MIILDDCGSFKSFLIQFLDYDYGNTLSDQFIFNKCSSYICFFKTPNEEEILYGLNHLQQLGVALFSSAEGWHELLKFKTLLGESWETIGSFFEWLEQKRSDKELPIKLKDLFDPTRTLRLMMLPEVYQNK
ncbi:MAG: hypothetical protein K0S74_782 [Chlamydiales bacterium]|jgi:hypothetical protein|nr:hypothetical protein [Chlamydiales bacterium]